MSLHPFEFGRIIQEYAKTLDKDSTAEITRSLNNATSLFQIMQNTLEFIEKRVNLAKDQRQLPDRNSLELIKELKQILKDSFQEGSF